MIIGIGSDLCNICRIEKIIQQRPAAFMRRIFSPAEQQEMQRRKHISPREYACMAAKRFAAKEACSKALGTGLASGTFWKDMQITRLSSGKPQLQISGGALDNLQKQIGEKSFAVHLTMTDDYPWAQAFVIIETI